MKLFMTALISAALFIWLPTQSTPVNNLESKPAHTIKAEKPAPAEKAAAIVIPTTKPEAQQVETQPEPAAVPDPPAGTHAELMAAAGIQASDYGAVDYIISHESSWNPNATEPNSGAHGLPQALPYSKTGCGWTDSVCQLQWASQYATSRYGSWWGAYNHWISNRWW